MKWGCTAIEGAAREGRLDTVHLLINMGAGVTGSRAAQFARIFGHDGVVELLLNNGFEEQRLAILKILRSSTPWRQP
jgi:ankyrin repeat protein